MFNPLGDLPSPSGDLIKKFLKKILTFFPKIVIFGITWIFFLIGKLFLWRKKMAKKGNKGTGADVLHCSCGGVVKVFSVFRNGKLRNEFRCPSCNRSADRYYLLKEN